MRAAPLRAREREPSRLNRAALRCRPVRETVYRITMAEYRSHVRRLVDDLTQRSDGETLLVLPSGY